MVKRKYTVDVKGKRTARAMVSNAAVSPKYSIEVSREIRGKTVVKAEAFLDNVVAKKEFVPLRRFNKHVAHRRGNTAVVKSGRYPVNVASVFLKLLVNVKANADFKGLNANNLRIVHVCANKGRTRFKMMKTKNSIKGGQTKSANIELVAEEM